MQLQLVAESCTICSSHSGRAVRKLLDTPSYVEEIFAYRCKGTVLQLEGLSGIQAVENSRTHHTARIITDL